MQPNISTHIKEYRIAPKGARTSVAGEHDGFSLRGTYACRHCNTPLYRSFSKFSPGRGWLSVDQEIPDAIKRLPDPNGMHTYLQAIQRMGLWVNRFSDPDGMRTEIECAACGTHLGHVFEGEGFASKNTRHCVNSISLKFIPKSHE